MDGNTALIVIVVIFAVVVVIGLLRYRSRGSASIEAGGMKMSVSGENAPDSTKDATTPPPVPIPTPSAAGVTIKDAKTGGGILAEAEGGPVDIERVETSDDIIASSKQNPDPKA